MIPIPIPNSSMLPVWLKHEFGRIVLEIIDV